MGRHEGFRPQYVICCAAFFVSPPELGHVLLFSSAGIKRCGTTTSAGDSEDHGRGLGNYGQRHAELMPVHHRELLTELDPMLLLTQKKQRNLNVRRKLSFIATAPRFLTSSTTGVQRDVHRQTKLKDGVRVEVRFLQCDLSGWLLPREFVHDEMVC
jgi:hypothetical protein